MSGTTERPSLWELYERERARVGTLEKANEMLDEDRKREKARAEQWQTEAAKSLALRDDARDALVAAQRECEGLRRLLWLRHGCSPSGLYGDDGEMQCNNVTCLLDFKRQRAEEIEARWIAVNRAALAAPAAGPSDSVTDAIFNALVRSK